MNAYEYTAITQDGKQKKGTLQAADIKSVRKMLRDQDLIPTNIAPSTQHGRGFLGFFNRKKISHQTLTLMTRQLATLLDANLPLAECLKGVAEQSESDVAKGLLLNLQAKVNEGYPLSQALEHHPKIFSQLYRASVAAGERSGDLAKVLVSLADYLEEQQRIKAKVSQALIYPSFVMLIAVVFTGVLLVTVVPQLLDVFADNEQDLPLVTEILLGLSALVSKTGWLIVLASVVGGIAFKKANEKTAFKARCQRFYLRLPMVGRLYQSVQTARFLRTLALLLHAGVPLLDALQSGRNVMSAIPLQDKLNTVVKSVKEGASLSAALKQTGIFSPMSLHMMASGERTGHLEPMIERAAKQQETEMEHKLGKGLALFEPVMILVMGGVVLFIVLAVLLPVFSATQMF